MQSDDINNIMFGSSPRKLNMLSDNFKFLQHIHPELKDVTARFIEDGTAQFLGRQLNVPVSDFSSKRKGRARDFCRDSEPFFNEFTKIPAISDFISQVNDCFVAMSKTLDAKLQCPAVDLSPPDIQVSETTDPNLVSKNFELLKKLHVKIDDMTDEISSVTKKLLSVDNRVVELKGESVSYRDALTKNIQKVEDKVGAAAYSHSASLVYNIRGCAKNYSSNLIFRCKKELVCTLRNDKLVVDESKVTKILKVITDPDDDVMVYQGFSVLFTRVFDKNVTFGIDFNSIEDRDRIWAQRFILGKKYNLFVDISLPTKQKKVRSTLIEEWYKFKSYKNDKGEQAASFLIAQRGIVFDSKFYKYESSKAVDLLKKHLDDLCNGDLYI